MINTRLSVAIHILALISKDNTLSSEKIASSVNTNPVVIRRIRGQLKKAGIIDVKRGLSGASLTRNPIDIDLLDIYRAVHINEELFRVHNNPNPECEVGRNIQSTLNSTFDEVQAKLENELKNITLDYVINKLQ